MSLNIPGAYPETEEQIFNPLEALDIEAPTPDPLAPNFLTPQRLFMLPKNAKKSAMRGIRPPVMRTPPYSLPDPTPAQAQDTRIAHLSLVACLLVFRINPQGRPAKRSASKEKFTYGMRRPNSPLGYCSPVYP